MSDRKPSVVKQYKDLEPGDVYLALGIPNDPEHAWTTAPNVHGETDGFGRDSNRLYSMVTLGGQWHIENTTNGDTFTVDLGHGLQWPTGTTLPRTGAVRGADATTITPTLERTNR